MASGHESAYSVDLDVVAVTKMMPFAEFWPLYLRAHTQRTTRAAHYVATAVGASASAAGVAMLEVRVIGAGIASAYILAIASHWLFERNQPMIGVNPFWGAVADIRMVWLAATGRLGAELTRHGAGAADGRSLPTSAQAVSGD